MSAICSGRRRSPLSFSAAGLGAPASAETLTIGVGTQDTTTNTVTTGVVIRELNLLVEASAQGRQIAGMEIKLDWQNFTSARRSPTA